MFILFGGLSVHDYWTFKQFAYIYNEHYQSVLECDKRVN